MVSIFITIAVGSRYDLECFSVLLDILHTPLSTDWSWSPTGVSRHLSTRWVSGSWVHHASEISSGESSRCPFQGGCSPRVRRMSGVRISKSRRSFPANPPEVRPLMPLTRGAAYQKGRCRPAIFQKSVPGRLSTTRPSPSLDSRGMSSRRKRSGLL